MAPVKFADLSKASSEVLNDDYQVKGFQLKTKQKTNLDGAILSGAVDLFGADCATPAKLTWKFPKPFGITGLSIDKLEMDKGGKLTLEAVADKSLHHVDNLKFEVKSDCKNLAATTVGCTFTGIADTQVKFETKQDMNFTAEVTRTLNANATLGLKVGAASLTAPDVGLKFAQGPVTASFTAKDKLTTFAGGCCYKVNNDMKVAATAEQGKDLKWGAGLAYAVMPGTSIKAKVQQDHSVSFGVKHELRKGFTVVAGGKFDSGAGKHSYGWQLSCE